MKIAVNSMKKNHSLSSARECLSVVIAEIAIGNPHEPWLTKENEESPSPMTPPLKGGELKESPRPLGERVGVRGILRVNKRIRGMREVF
jgi:hypothetical protein